MNSTLQPVSLPPLAAATLDITFETDALTTLVRPVRAARRRVPRALAGARARHLGAVAPRPRPPRARRPPRQLHQGHRHRARRDPARQRHHDERRRQWRVQRKLIQPAFHRKVVATWMPHIEAATVRPRARSGSGPPTRGEPVNVTQDMSEAALDVVLRALFGAGPRRCSRPPPAAIRSRCSPTTPSATSRSRTSSGSSGKLIMHDVERRRRDGDARARHRVAAPRRARPPDGRARCRTASCSTRS